MKKTLILSILGCFPFLLLSQIERIYDPSGHLRTVNPINEQGEYEGKGYSYYPGGALASETPFHKGEIEGVVREFFEDGSLKASTSYQSNQKHGQEVVYYATSRVKVSKFWEHGHLEGPMLMNYPSGELYLYSYLQQDSVLFAQHFDSAGFLTRELMGSWSQPVDLSKADSVRFRLENGDALVAGVPNKGQVVLPGIPLALVQFSARGGELKREIGDPLPFFLTLTPEPNSKEMVVYLRISLRPGANPSLLRSIKIPVR